MNADADLAGTRVPGVVHVDDRESIETARSAEPKCLHGSSFRGIGSPRDMGLRAAMEIPLERRGQAFVASSVSGATLSIRYRALCILGLQQRAKLPWDASQLVV